jgi:hypothetical protein
MSKVAKELRRFAVSHIFEMEQLMMTLLREGEICCIKVDRTVEAVK